VRAVSVANSAVEVVRTDTDGGADGTGNSQTKRRPRTMRNGRRPARPNVLVYAQRHLCRAGCGTDRRTVAGRDVTEGVVRVGDTVRRPVNPQSAAIHAYLYHLEQAGFLEAPRFLGVDGRGREVLTYIEGEIGGRPLYRWSGGEDVLVAIARFQRRMHDCSLGFTLPAGVEWRKPLRIDGVPPAFEVPELIGHNDMTPENLIFRDGVPVGIIDFDLAGPTTRLLDVIVTLRWWAPLCDPVDRDPVMRHARPRRR
jgi:hypothetical protein